MWCLVAAFLGLGTGQVTGSLVANLFRVLALLVMKFLILQNKPQRSLEVSL